MVTYLHLSAVHTGEISLADIDPDDLDAMDHNFGQMSEQSQDSQSAGPREWEDSEEETGAGVYLADSLHVDILPFFDDPHPMLQSMVRVQCYGVHSLCT